MYVKPLALFACCLFLCGCGLDDLVRDESKAWRDEMAKQIQETRDMAKGAADTAVRAVPGERWLQIIDDLNGKDEAKVTAAREYLKKVAKIDLVRVVTIIDSDLIKIIG
jgi:uncharacterized iron-regulated protein